MEAKEEEEKEGEVGEVEENIVEEKVEEKIIEEEEITTDTSIKRLPQPLQKYFKEVRDRRSAPTTVYYIAL